jgi:hypothetical protein
MQNVVIGINAMLCPHDMLIANLWSSCNLAEIFIRFVFPDHDPFAWSQTVSTSLNQKKEKERSPLKHAIHYYALAKMFPRLTACAWKWNTRTNIWNCGGTAVSATEWQISETAVAPQ